MDWVKSKLDKMRKKQEVQTAGIKGANISPSQDVDVVSITLMGQSIETDDGPNNESVIMMAGKMYNTKTKQEVASKNEDLVLVPVVVRTVYHYDPPYGKKGDKCDSLDMEYPLRDTYALRCKDCDKHNKRCNTVGQIIGIAKSGNLDTVFSLRFKNIYSSLHNDIMHDIQEAIVQGLDGNDSAGGFSLTQFQITLSVQSKKLNQRTRYTLKVKDVAIVEHDEEDSGMLEDMQESLLAASARLTESRKQYVEMKESGAGQNDDPVETDTVEPADANDDDMPPF